MKLNSFHEEGSLLLITFYFGLGAVVMVGLVIVMAALASFVWLSKPLKEELS